MQHAPLIIDIAGTALTDDDRRRLAHPLVGGLILFARNWQSRAQLSQLSADIKRLRPDLLICVDHEGGRVQRFRADGFTHLPPMRALGELWMQDAMRAQDAASACGYVLAAELRACGVDFSFTPVLDLDWGPSGVIGDRAFHADARVVTMLAKSLTHGLLRAGMAHCGKHFPGHGFVEGDSHHVLPQDNRSLAELEAADIVPFCKLSAEGMAAVMPAHVVYPQIDAQPAGFSEVWLKQILRHKIGFNGVIFSDDLTMEGACGAGGIKARAQLSFDAGCDIVLVCNRPDLVDELRAGFAAPANPDLAARWQYMANTLRPSDAAAMMDTPEFKAAQSVVAALATPKDIAGGVKVGEAF